MESKDIVLYVSYLFTLIIFIFLMLKILTLLNNKYELISNTQIKIYLSFIILFYFGLMVSNHVIRTKENKISSSVLTLMINTNILLYVSLLFIVLYKSDLMDDSNGKTTIIILLSLFILLSIISMVLEMIV